MTSWIVPYASVNSVDWNDPAAVEGYILNQGIAFNVTSQNGQLSIGDQILGMDSFKFKVNSLSPPGSPITTAAKGQITGMMALVQGDYGFGIKESVIPFDNFYQATGSVVTSILDKGLRQQLATARPKLLNKMSIF